MGLVSQLQSQKKEQANKLKERKRKEANINKIENKHQPKELVFWKDQKTNSRLIKKQRRKIQIIGTKKEDRSAAVEQIKQIIKDIINKENKFEKLH